MRCNVSLDNRFKGCVVGCRKNRNTAMIEITKDCNLKCDYCCVGQAKVENKKITKSQLNNILIFLKKWAANYVYITGGEPYTFKEIDYFIKILHENSVNFSIASNGVLIKDRNIQVLKTAKPEYISISFDNLYVDTFNWNDYDYIKIKTIGRLIENNIKLRISIPVLGKNLCPDKTKEFCKIIRSFKYSTLHLRFIENTNDAASKYYIPYNLRNRLKHSLEKAFNKLSIDLIFQGISQGNNNDRKSTEKCPGGNNVCFIDSDLKVWACSWLAKSQSNPEFGSLDRPNNLGVLLMNMNHFQNQISETESERTCLFAEGFE